MVVEFGRSANVVDIELVQSLIRGKGLPGPDDRGGIEWGNKKGESGGRDVVDEMAVRQIAAREVEEMTTLSAWYASAST